MLHSEELLLTIHSPLHKILHWLYTRFDETYMNMENQFQKSGKEY